MKKAFYQSKTVWGFGIALLLGFLQAQGILDVNVLTEALQYLATGLGVYGARDALN